LPDSSAPAPEPDSDKGEKKRKVSKPVKLPSKTPGVTPSNPFTKPPDSTAPDNSGPIELNGDDDIVQTSGSAQTFITSFAVSGIAGLAAIMAFDDLHLDVLVLDVMADFVTLFANAAIATIQV
jgi:hypothetical protein